jgi:hypothetical protein
MEEAYGAIGTDLVILGVVLLVLWTVLPFYVVAMNTKLADLLRAQHETNKLLGDLKLAAQNLAYRQESKAK